MRTWYVPLTVLDDNRMIAQHREIHTVIGSVLSPRKGFQNHPVIKLYLNEHLPCLTDYHEATVREMERRGWHGHQTPLSHDIRIIAAMTWQSSPACANWKDHVKRVVPMSGQYSIHGDLHDLVERWTREGKALRNNVAAGYVQAHLDVAEDTTCADRAKAMLDEYKGRTMSAAQPKVRGNASLRGATEVLEMNYTA